ncbi:MAG: hypothetical protein PHQ23_12585 [Candidatus Wallbacteria bacterium]|nr:hypothetical protein [Candidatus Wallbacteria bacterium]
MLKFARVLIVIMVIGLMFHSEKVFSDELDDLLGGGGPAATGDTAPVDGSVSGAVSEDDGLGGLIGEEEEEDAAPVSAEPVDTENYMVSELLVKYFNDDPAEDGNYLNPFESLVKPPAPPKSTPMVARGQEAPKPLRLKLNGVVSNGDVRFALIENLDKKESYELGEGEKTADFSVVEITDDKVVTFDYRLNMRRTITVSE